jgi:hypothetical protein
LQHVRQLQSLGLEEIQPALRPQHNDRKSQQSRTKHQQGVYKLHKQLMSDGEHQQEEAKKQQQEEQQHMVAGRHLQEQLLESNGPKSLLESSTQKQEELGCSHQLQPGTSNQPLDCNQQPEQEQQQQQQQQQQLGNEDQHGDGGQQALVQERLSVLQSARLVFIREQQQIAKVRGPQTLQLVLPVTTLLLPHSFIHKMVLWL